MTITLNIRPELQAELARQAALQGRPIESVATALLEGAVHPASAGPPATATPPGHRTGRRRLPSDGEGLTACARWPGGH